MDFDRFKSAWQKQSLEPGLPFSGPMSRSFQFWRTSTIRDLQGSEELTRLIFSLLFGLAVIGASLVVMPSGAGRVVAWLFAGSLLVDGMGGLALLIRHFREPGSSNLVEYIAREERRAQTRFRFEQYSQSIMVLLAALAVLLLVFGPKPVNFRDDVFRMGITTAFLAVAWRRAKSRSRSREIRQELQNYLKDLQG